jgi:hypothetical protein
MTTLARWMRVSMVVGLLGLAAACSGDDDSAGSGTPGVPGAGGSDDGSGEPGGSDGTGGSDDGSGAIADPNEPAAPGVPPAYAPQFPGAGTSGVDAPLTNGELCDYVPLDGAPTPQEITKCFFGADDPVPAATLEQVLECVDGADVVHIRLTFNPGFVDNTYGTGAIGWSPRRGHTWTDLHKSDHAEIQILNEAGEVVFQFKLDYVTADSSAPSGWASLGIAGGDGSVITGDPAWLLDWNSSISRNLNERGYDGYLVDSPATDADYTANPETPEWDYRVVYEAWIDVAALGDGGFGGANIEHVHASPAKTPSDTIEVEEGECPPDFCTDPDGCYEGPPPPPPCSLDPDAPCGDSRLDGGTPPPPDDMTTPDAGTPVDCLEIPDDPRCRVD